MRNAITFGLVATLSIIYGATAQTNTPTAEHAAVGALKTNFDRWLETPDAYRHRALGECAGFPEGRIYPFLMPALAYANLAADGVISKEEAVRKSKLLIDLALPLVAETVKAPEGDLMKLETYQHHATFLSTLNLALSHHGRLTQENKFEALNNHLSLLLLTALEEAEGGPTQSYPEYHWNIDTMVALASLHAWDNKTCRDRVEAAFERHMEWLDQNATEPSGLPRAAPGQTSRGCDLSFRILLLNHLDPERGKALYEKYVAHHWIENGAAFGFSEWPNTTEGALFADADSGPVILGIGSVATGLGIGAAKAVCDTERHQRLLNELQLAAFMIRSTAQLAGESDFSRRMDQYAPISAKYYSGFLYGDAALFYALTQTAVRSTK